METTEVASQNRGAADRGISRRTVMKGAAWSVPVIALAAAAPQATASCIPTGGVLYYVGLPDRNASTGPVEAELFDATGFAPGATMVSAQHSELVLLDGSTGEWWFRDPATTVNGAGTMLSVEGTPPIESVWGGQFGIDADGNVYRASVNPGYTTTTATLIGGASDIVQVYDSDTVSTTYAIDAEGKVWRLLGNNWVPVTKNSASGGGELIVDSMADSDEVYGYPVFISTTGQVWKANGGSVATPWPQGAPTAPDNVVRVVGGSTWYYAQDSDGSLWMYTNGGDWAKVTDGPVLHLTYSYNGKAMYVEDGKMYYVSYNDLANPQEYTNLPFDPDTIVDTVSRDSGGEGWYAQLSDGTWWGSRNATYGVYQITGTPGGTVTQITRGGFALAGTAAGC